MRIFSHVHFALSKPQDLLSTVVLTSTITAVNEVVKNKMGPDEKETLEVLSLMNQTHPSTSHLLVT